MPIDDGLRQLATEQLSVLQRADEFERLLQTPGWTRLFALHEEWAEKYAKAAKQANTGSAAEALDALRQWQLAEEFLRLEADFINSTLEQARALRGTRTLEEALLMEQLQHEHEPGTADPAGY